MASELEEEGQSADLERLEDGLSRAAERARRHERVAADPAARSAASGISLEGMVLLKHGLFSFGDTAEQSYGRMIELVRLAEQRLERGERRLLPLASPPPAPDAASLLPRLRGALGVVRRHSGGSDPVGVVSSLLIPFQHRKAELAVQVPQGPLQNRRLAGPG